ncbi:hypothetical protein OA250_02175 [Candidatus Pelagibacter sp.]|nr:hypothetical protein [Candidatus Pelagibacter sp.]
MLIYYQKFLELNSNEVVRSSMKIYIIWLIGVIIWNFGFPNAIPLADVVAAILLSFLSIILNKYLKF